MPDDLLRVRDEIRHNIIKKLVIISTRVLVDLLFVGAKTSSEKRGVKACRLKRSYKSLI